MSTPEFAYCVIKGHLWTEEIGFHTTGFTLTPKICLVCDGDINVTDECRTCNAPIPLQVPSPTHCEVCKQPFPWFNPEDPESTQELPHLGE